MSVAGLSWYYLSFADSERFRGGIYTQAASGVAALGAVSRRGLNPGGGVLIVGPLPDDELERQVSPSDRERLLTAGEVEPGELHSRPAL